MQQRSTAFRDHQSDSFGMLLKHWREQRGYSQLKLALKSQVSQRHISFLESGRAKPSQDMVIQLATVLEIPMRQQNLMLTAAGFAPIYAETDLSAPEMTSIRQALDFMLQQQEPYPALVVDRYWNLLLPNNGATRLINSFIDPHKLQTLFYRDGKINLMRVVFHSQGVRPFIVNWEDFANQALQRLHREVNAYSGSLPNLEGESEPSSLLLNELMSYPGVSEIWQTSHKTAQNALLLTLHLKREDMELQFFSTIATLGTPYDITLQELRIECLFPADETTERIWKKAIA
ncbi:MULTISPECIES: helix-turn-helix domain-containing protein [Nostocales]|uniref:DNA-binding protein n=3 Tax=Nostocales TaxID=1161 RepID=A0A0C1R9A0_9CYAN|nr:helix-turn-helix domain-containing protein [Tolypothrix bouteillei]KAF3885433.1 helix-turn-helix transcriptional regulator [Tolypothrix bouteillei VB521301]